MNPITDSYDLVFNDRTLLVLLCLKKMAFVYALIRGIALLKEMAFLVLKINGEDLGNLSWFGVMISYGYLGTIEKIMLLIDSQEVN